MTSARAYPPGPTWQSERKKSLKTRYEELSQGPISFIRRRFETYGDIYYVTNRGAPMYVTRHPDHMHEVLVTKASSFAKRSKDLDMFLGDGLLISNGELWRRQRRLIQPAFHSQRIAGYAPVMVEYTQRMISQWKSGEVRDINRDMMELTLAVVSKALLDHDPESEHDAVAHAMTVIQETGGRFDLFPRWFPTPRHLVQRRAVRELDRIIFAMIDARSGGVRAGDLISELKNESDEQGTMSRKQLRDELVTLFLAGHETTALTMSWTLFLLSGYPEEEAKLHEELDRVLGDRAPRFEDYESLAYTKLAVMEGMRLFPPLFILPRVATEETEVAGFPIAPGSEFVLWVYFAQRDARWYPQPTEFRPARWMPDSGEVLHPHAYLPFGAGMRTCIGRHFAMLESTLLLAAIAQKFKLRVVNERPVTMNARVTLGPREPILMRVEARK